MLPRYFSQNMPLRDLEIEDLLLLGASATTLIAVVADQVYAHPFFTVLKIVGVVVSLGTAVHRIRTAKPYYRDVSLEDWTKESDGYRFSIRNSEHKRGKYPSARCLFRQSDGTYQECFADAVANEDGDLTIRANSHMAIRVEVRK